MPVPWLREVRPAGWVTYCSICASTMQRAQNRTGKGSILLWRRFTFPIYALYILQQHCFNKIVLLVTWPIYFHAWIDAHVYKIFKQIFFFWLTGETCLSVLLYFLYTVHTVLHKRSCHPQDLLWVHGLVVFCLELPPLLRFEPTTLTIYPPVTGTRVPGLAGCQYCVEPAV